MICHPRYAQLTFDEIQDNEIYLFNLYDKRRLKCYYEKNYQKQQNFINFVLKVRLDVRWYVYVIGLCYLYKKYLMDYEYNDLLGNLRYRNSDE